MLAISRIMVAWQPVGLAMGVYDMCARYVRERRQFGAPLGAFQLVQERLARMQGDVQAMFLMAWRLSVLQEQARWPRVCCLYYRVNLLAGKCMANCKHKSGSRHISSHAYHVARPYEQTNAAKPLHSSRLAKANNKLLHTA